MSMTDLTRIKLESEIEQFDPFIKYVQVVIYGLFMMCTTIASVSSCSRHLSVKVLVRYSAIQLWKELCFGFVCFIVSL